MSGGAEWILGQRRARIVRGALASLFALAVRILLQIGQVPLFLHFWSTELFGEWLLVTSIPSYLALSGLGFGTAAGNAISRLSASGNQHAVRAIIRASFLVLTVSSLVACAAIILLGEIVDLPQWLGLRRIIDGEFKQILILLCLLVFVRMQFGLSESAFRANGRYPSYVMLDNIIQVLELIGATIALIVAGTASAVLIGMLTVRLSALVATFYYVATRYRWIIYGNTEPLKPWISQLIWPSFGFLIIPISQSLNLQGTLMIVGHYFGPASVALLSTARTLARLIETVLGIIYNLVYEEVGYAAGAKDQEGLRRLMTWSTVLTTAMAVVLSASLLLLGPSIYKYWTHGKINLDYGVLIAVILAGVVRAFSTPAAAVLAGLNQHSRYSLVLLASTLLALVFAILLRGMGLSAIAASSIIMEVLIAVYAVPRGIAAAGMSFADIAANLKDPAGLLKVARRFRFRR